MFHIIFYLRVFRWRFISVIYHVMWRDINHTIDIQTMSCINSDGPKMPYINKRLINGKNVENKDKVTWCQNRIQSIVLQLYTNALLCMLDYIASASSTINPPVLWRCLRYINAHRASFMMASRSSSHQIHQETYIFQCLLTQSPQYDDI